MANLMDIIRGPYRRLTRKINRNYQKIDDNLEKIDEIYQLRKGKQGRNKSDDKKGKKLVDDRRKYERENSNYRSEIKEWTNELISLIDAKDAVSLCINSKTYSGGINRYNRMIKNINRYHEKTHSFIKNLEKSLDSLLMHTKHRDIPTTNNGIELCHRHTLNGYDKRKYKTVGGIAKEMDYKRIRWNKRLVLGWA